MKQTAIALCLTLIFGSVSLYAQETNPADFNGSGSVDFTDFLMFAQGFGKSAGQTDFNAALDLDSSGTIDFPDFLQFVSAFSGSTGTTDPTPVDLPSTPEELLLYIADLTAGNIQVLNASTNLLDPSRTITASQPRGVAISTTNNQVYVAAVDSFHAFESDGTPAFQLSLVTPAEPGAPFTSRGGFRVVLSPNHQFAYVSEEFGPAIEIIDVLAEQSLNVIPVPLRPSGIVLSPDGTRLYVGHGDGAGAVSIIDTNIPALIDSISVGQAVNRLALSPDGQTLYVNNTHAGRLLKLDTTTRTVTDSLALGQVSDLDVNILDVGISSDGTLLAAVLNRVFFGFDSLGNPTPVFWGGIVVIDTQTWAQVAEITVGELIANMGMTPDGKTAYVAGLESLSDQTTGNLQVFIVDLENNASLGTIRGLSLPVAFSFNASKPTIPKLQFPELTIF